LRTSPQTTKGKDLWAKRNLERGRDYEYDLDYYVRLNERLEKENTRSKPHQRTNRQDQSKKKEVIDVDSDKSSGDELYDEDE
jgi:hypothetical protein